MVEGKLPGNYKALLGRTHKVSFSDQAVRVLINTDYHREHTSLNTELLAGGAKVLAQEQANLLDFGNAHTNGDTVVFFPDFAAGGSLAGWGEVLGDILKLDFDVAVPDTGAVVTQADVARLKTKLDTLVARARSNWPIK